MVERKKKQQRVTRSILKAFISAHKRSGTDAEVLSWWNEEIAVSMRKREVVLRLEVAHDMRRVFKDHEGYIADDESILIWWNQRIKLNETVPSLQQ